MSRQGPPGGWTPRATEPLLRAVQPAAADGRVL